MKGISCDQEFDAVDQNKTYCVVDTLNDVFMSGESGQYSLRQDIGGLCRWLRLSRVMIQASHRGGLFKQQHLT